MQLISSFLYSRASNLFFTLCFRCIQCKRRFRWVRYIQLRTLIKFNIYQSTLLCHFFSCPSISPTPNEQTSVVYVSIATLCFAHPPLLTLLAPQHHLRSTLVIALCIHSLNFDYAESPNFRMCYSFYLMNVTEIESNAIK